MKFGVCIPHYGIPLDVDNLTNMADHMWLVGSPETVAVKIRRLHENVGAVGPLTI